jgi:hypothetical protein
MLLIPFLSLKNRIYSLNSTGHVPDIGVRRKTIRMILARRLRPYYTAPLPIFQLLFERFL